MRILKISKFTALFLALALLLSLFPVSALPQQADLKAAAAQEFSEETEETSDGKSDVTIGMLMTTLRYFTGLNPAIYYEAPSYENFIDWINTTGAETISGYDADRRKKINRIITAIRKEDSIILPVYEGKLLPLFERGLTVTGSDSFDSGYEAGGFYENLSFRVRYADEENKQLLESGYEKYLEQVYPDYPRLDNWAQINQEKKLALADMYMEDIEINGKNTACRITVWDIVGVTKVFMVEFILDLKIVSVYISQAAYDQGMLQKITFEPVSLHVSIKDAVELLRYLAGEIPLSELSWNAFNINDEITIKNAVRMLQSLAGIS